MKAEDTVMSYEDSLILSSYREQIEKVAGEAGLKLWWAEVERFLQRQAAISFKAGIREVVEWIMANSMVEECDPDVMAYFEDYRLVDEHDWQSKLKEWGIDER